MYQFAVLLRALACILITNSHMESVYPNKIFANGGLLGDVLFFALSGFLLYAKEQPVFFKWYYKRLKREYISRPGSWYCFSGTAAHMAMFPSAVLFSCLFGRQNTILFLLSWYYTLFIISSFGLSTQV